MRGRASSAGRRFALAGAGALLCLSLANCSNSPHIDPRYGVAPSPRVVDFGEEVPKGGGAYRVGAPYVVAGRVYVPEENPHYRAEGLASWYGDDFHGRATANGEVFDVDGITAAHPTLPLPSYARVTNLSNGRSLIVRVNDRGPYHGNRIIDVSKRAAHLLGFHRSGTAMVRVEYVGRAPMEGSDDRVLAATLRRTNQLRIRAASGSPRRRSFLVQWRRGRRGIAVSPQPRALTVRLGGLPRRPRYHLPVRPRVVTAPTSFSTVAVSTDPLVGGPPLAVSFQRDPVLVLSVPSCARNVPMSMGVREQGRSMCTGAVWAAADVAKPCEQARSACGLRRLLPGIGSRRAHHADEKRQLVPDQCAQRHSPRPRKRQRAV